jgi:hypothetical protein
MHQVDLPGLVGDEPFGFLAAIGLLNQMLGSGSLSWDERDHHAVVHSERYSSITDLVAMLVGRLNDVKEGEAIPYTRVRPAEYRGLLNYVKRSSGGQHLLKATITSGATDADGFCAVNPLVAVRGRQTIGSFWYYPMLEVRKDPQRLLTEALAGWRRVEGCEGWLLDHRATYSMAPDLRGPGGSMAVPGATWLATLAVESFGYRTSYGAYSGSKPLPSGWFHTGGRDVFVWPLWTLPAGRNTLEAVWNVGWGYGDWELAPSRGGALKATISATHGVMAPNGVDHTVDFGIFSMRAADRPADGPLTPVPVHIHRKPSLGGEYKAWKGWDWQYPDLGIRW